MARESPSEITLIRESGRWCPHAHRLLQEYTQPGATEAEASLRARDEATLAMLEELGVASGGRPLSIEQGLRRATGDRSGGGAGRSTRSRTTSSSAPGRARGETGAPVWGYDAELERALMIGPPTDEEPRPFDHVVASQRVAFNALRPGATCADVDGAVHQLLRRSDLLLFCSSTPDTGSVYETHEAPFSRRRRPHRLLKKPGMVFTVEPGLYDPRRSVASPHSDTVVVTKGGGVELLPRYPSRPASLTLTA